MRVNLLEAQRLKGEEQFAAYAALDVTGTREVYDILRPRLNADQRRIYTWSKAQLSPAIAMGLRGIRVDEKTRDVLRAEIVAEIELKLAELQRDPLIAQHWDGTELETGDCPSAGERWKAVAGKCTDGKNHKWPKDWKTDHAALCAKCKAPRWERIETPGKHKWPRGLEPTATKCEQCGTPRLKRKAFAPTSHPACHHLFYEVLLCPPVMGKDRKITTDDDALERIGRDGLVFISKALAEEFDSDTIAGRKRKRTLPGLRELTDKVRHLRDLNKQRGFLETKLSPTSRFHCSFNVAAPWTGRWSSSADPFEIGSNAQNITERFRHMFVADRGKRMCYADLKTAESLQVAYLSGCEAYIEAHKGDVHTYVCRELWPELPWTGDIRADKKIAQSLNPPWDDVPGHDYRFQSKRIQHGSNYGLSPFGMAMIAHIPLAHAKAAQARYFDAFPEIREWQDYQGERVRNSLPLYNALRRTVRLFGRPKDGHTYKQGLAFPPQSGVGDVLNIGLWRVWNACDPHLIELLAQVHDAILCQFREEDEAAAVAALRELMTVHCPITDIRGVTRVCTIPVEIAVGRNWGKFNDKPDKGPINLDGLVEV